MLGILLIYFIGKSYYQLAQKYEKHKWGFAILGVASYYFGTIVGGVLIYLAVDLGLSSIDNMPDVAVGFMVLPFGILACWGLHTILKRQWSNTQVKGGENVLDVLE
ncbi:hypothetical protein QQ008_29755 [Fulvivirgaceae bacterium BMA10]|uniref:Uncharacterized protein n=1 Tax=Splendidivirga corallicola TaxID=3051826 RepID=A0ABT8L0B6_9BACT|nr:hypothetical protein [Fulvivirgaceae bacterium BMA10]